jgi:hypothetical protein
VVTSVQMPGKLGHVCGVEKVINACFSPKSNFCTLLFPGRVSLPPAIIFRTLVTEIHSQCSSSTYSHLLRSYDRLVIIAIITVGRSRS